MTSRKKTLIGSKKDVPKKIRTEPTIPPSYSLDLAFSSTTQALSADQPILAMAYGFSKLPEGLTWRGEGQKAEKVDWNSPFYFTVYDTAPGKVERVSRIEIDFGGDTPFLDSSQQPVKNPIVRTGYEIASQHGHSAGCNVLGTYSLIGPYTVKTVLKSTTFRCTVKVTTESGQVFSIDPEIIVEGGG
jgi:hypothetical protein